MLKIFEVIAVAHDYITKQLKREPLDEEQTADVIGDLLLIVREAWAEESGEGCIVVIHSDGCMAGVTIDADLDNDIRELCFHITPGMMRRVLEARDEIKDPLAREFLDLGLQVVQKRKDAVEMYGGIQEGGDWDVE